MRPFRTFLLFFFFLTCFTGLYYLVPWKDPFPPVTDFISEDIIRTIPGQKTQNPESTELSDSLPTVFVTPSDSVAPQPVKTGNSLLDSLDSTTDQIRIMYYGDSQIEGDRITFYLRNFLRDGRTGAGPGLFLPAMPVMYTKSVWIRSSSNWLRYNYLSADDGEISHTSLGPFMTICRFLPEGEKTTAPEKAFVRIRSVEAADSANSEIVYLRIIYGNTPPDVSVSVRSGTVPVFQGYLKSGPGVNEVSLPLVSLKDIIIEFEGRESPDIYGISLESKTGIIVDNIPLRGSAGLEFTMVNKENLREIYKLLDPDLIILHYGLNVVKNVSSNYDYYSRGLVRQLALLKEIAPGSSILLAGVSDMANYEGDSIKSYSNIPVIVRAQKEAAEAAGVVFWDTYSAMGGESSIIRWARKKPPLAKKDFVHFTDSGADTISMLLAREYFIPSVNEIATAKEENEILPSVVPVPETAVAVEEPESLFQVIISQIFDYNQGKPLIFTSSSFWLFFLILLAGYSIVYRKIFLRNFYLLIFSLFFYYKSGGFFLILLIMVIIIDFFCGLLIHRSGKKFARRFFILLSIVSNLGILAYFKYADFIITSVNDLFGTDFLVYDFLSAYSNTLLGTTFDFSSIILPVGISFFTFQSLSYTIDIYRRKISPVKSILDFGFYVSFFPQLVAGPIVRASEFMPQLYNHFSLGKREFSHSIFLISKGLIKKIVISDFIAGSFIDRVFEMPDAYSGFENLMAVYGYGLQIYCDFSGYTDIAIGVALLLGFRLPLNFNSPYKAAGLTDFWRRWHISLSRWLKDYLYISLGGNRNGKFRTGLNILITMLLGGLWHGASMRFLIWGGLHGTGLIISKGWSRLTSGRIKTGSLSRGLSVFLTFQFVSFAWIFFRATDMNNVSLMLNQIFRHFSPESYSNVITAFTNVFLLIGIGYLFHFLPEKVKESYRGFFIRIPVPVQMLMLLAVAMMLYQMRTPSIVPFIYFRF